jgi:hypothetical protein
LTLDTDTTVHTLYDRQMGARKSYNPKNKGKKSYQPILTFLAGTREYVAGELRNGDRPTGKQIARPLRSAFQSLPEGATGLQSRGGVFQIRKSRDRHRLHRCVASPASVHDRQGHTGAVGFQGCAALDQAWTDGRTHKPAGPDDQR